MVRDRTNNPIKASNPLLGREPASLQYDACANPGCGHIRRSHAGWNPAAPSGSGGCLHCRCQFWQEPAVEITGDARPAVTK